MDETDLKDYIVALDNEIDTDSVDLDDIIIYKLTDSRKRITRGYKLE